MKRIPRKIVYEVIDSERKYQEEKYGKTKSGNVAGEGERSIDEFALYLVGQSNELTKICAFSSDKDAALSIMRKMAALCVDCMEQHGIVWRD